MVMVEVAAVLLVVAPAFVVRRVVRRRVQALRRTADGARPHEVRGGAPLGLRLALTTVAASVRSGTAPARAWRAIGVDVGRFDAPAVGHVRSMALRDLAREGSPPPGAPAGMARRLRRGPSGAVRDLAAQQAAAVAGACAVAGELGAPLAEVLDELGSAVADHREGFDERAAALAGPRASARVLGWLPVVTLLGAAGLGAHPWRTAADGGLGTLAMVLGTGLLLVGRRWTRALVERAERVDAPPTGPR